MRSATLVLKLRSLAKRHGSAIVFSGSQSVAQIATMIAQFVSLRFIPPEHIGAWQTVIVIDAYLKISQLGIISALNREYPHAYADENYDSANEMMRTAGAFNLLNALLYGAIFSGLMLWNWSRGSVWHWAFGAMAVVSALNLIFGYLGSMCRCTGNFNRLSGIHVLRIMVVALIPVCSYFYGFAGYCAGQLLVMLVLTICLFLIRPIKQIPVLNISTFKLLFSTGWRLIIRHYLMKMGKMMPRTALGMIGGTTALGLFAPVSAMNSMLTNITAGVEAYLLPKLTAKVAKRKAHCGKLAIRAWLTIMATLLPILLIGELLIPILIDNLIPAYHDSIPAMRVAMLAGFFQSSDSAATIFTAAKAWRYLYLHAGIRIVTVIICVFGGALLCDDRLLGVATGMAIASALMIIPTWILASRIGVGGAYTVNAASLTAST